MKIIDKTADSSGSDKLQVAEPDIKILKTGTRDVRVEELKFGKSNCGY